MGRVMESIETISRYEIIGELGSGAMSRVYLAHDPNLDRKVALKVVLANLTLDSEAQRELHKRFLLEARAAGKLTHPGIVSVYDADTDPVSGAPYIAMEWVQGRSLRSLLEERKQIPIPRAAEILSQVAAALDYAHGMGRIHRDIKPSNILIGRDGRAKISDFGVAKIVAEPYTVSGQILGTPLFMSPEQVKDEPIDGRSDLFSLGVVLYQCVTGQLPFAGDSLAQVVYKILHTDPHPPQLGSSEGAPLLRDVLERSLMKDPGARYQTGGEFAAALDRVRQAYAGEPADEEEQGAIATPAGQPPIGAEELPAETAPTWQLSTGEIREAIESGSKVDADREREEAPPLDLSGTGPVRRNARRLVLGAVWVALLVALTAVVVGRTTGRSPLPSIGVTEPFAALPEQTSPAETAASSDEPAPSERARAGAEESEPRIAFPSSPPPAEPEAVIPTEQKKAGKDPARRGPKSSASSSAGLQQPVFPQPQPTLDDSPGKSGQAPVAKGKTKTSPSQKRSDPLPTAFVEVVYRNYLRESTMTISVDGEIVWQRNLTVSNPLKKMTGKQIKTEISVPQGVHSVRVRVSSPEAGVDAARTLKSLFHGGEARVLGVSLEAKENILYVYWKG